ncbi:MAG: hypothetical protein ABIP27_11700 [Flavobacterium circumlabens]|uniref:Uncharacterized protein n=1 Tax=Flavobacterium circumlabens TaxID=2133765 RepID=A0ABY2B0J2_9FLAO|nr:hypothetical protein [Flavobacterium circumlabens]TCN58897.1 hypothetical protein EV142_103344 [Flavobacterium circumlabens]
MKNYEILLTVAAFAVGLNASTQIQEGSILNLSTGKGTARKIQNDMH